MTRPPAARIGRAGAVAVWFLLAIAAVAGATLILRSVALPEYDDPTRASLLQSWTSCYDHPQCRDSWHVEMEKLRSAKWPMRNMGVGLCVLSAWLGALMVYYRVDDLRQVARIVTPRSKLAILGGGCAVWIGQLNAEWEHILRDAGRGYYPSWGDSLGIPFFYLSGVAALLPIPLIVGWLILWRARLPADLWLWDRTCPWRSGIATAVFAPFVLLEILFLYTWVVDGSTLGIPVELLALYLTLSARTAIISWRGWSRAPAHAATFDAG